MHWWLYAATLRCSLSQTTETEAVGVAPLASLVCPATTTAGATALHDALVLVNAFCYALSAACRRIVGHIDLSQTTEAEAIRMAPFSLLVCSTTATIGATALHNALVLVDAFSQALTASNGRIYQHICRHRVGRDIRLLDL